MRDLFADNKDAVKDWFNNGSFKDLRITSRKGSNGSTDINGTISLSPTKAKLFTEAMEKIRKAEELTLEQEMAMATMWHEINHNMNQGTSIPRMTKTEERYMELGNEFVSRKTLGEFFEAVGGKLSNKSLNTDRYDTGYNTMVRNYDQMIKKFGVDEGKVLAHLRERMRNGNYGEVKTYLMDAVTKNAGDKIAKKDVNIAVMDAIRLSEADFAKKYPTR